MFTIAIIILDILLALFIVLTVAGLFRAVFMRLRLIKEINSICAHKKYTLKKLRHPLTSIFYKSKKIDLTVTTSDTVYHIKFVSALSSKQIYHFIDENNYITYFKTYFALPMATKASESTHFLSYHWFPTVDKTKESGNKYVLLFNPLPNEISYIAKDGSSQIASTGSMIGDFYVYNGKGFCSLINDTIV